jgi:hypothetical protein
VFCSLDVDITPVRLLIKLKNAISLLVHCRCSGAMIVLVEVDDSTCLLTDCLS